MTTIVDYGAGNIRSVQNTLDELGRGIRSYTNSPDGRERATKIILPGVGHFGQMMRALDELGLRDTFAGAESAPACRSSASASVCNVCSNEAKNRPAAAVSAFFRRSEAIHRRRRGFRTWAGTRSTMSSHRAC